MARDVYLSSDDFGLKMYNRFPPFYREEDEKVNFALKRYLQACGDGGFKYAIDEWNGILDIYNPSNIDYNMLTILYHQFGFELFYGIPEEYLRYLLPRLSEAYRKKGAIDVIEFVVSALSGIKTSTEVIKDDSGIDLIVRLEMDFAMSDFFPDAKQFNRILDQFTPFYLDRTLVYSYVFYEAQKVWLAENYFHDLVKEIAIEQALIPFDKGTRYAPVLNQLAYVLNKNFILNGVITYAQDPDWFTDVIGTLYHEIQALDKNVDGTHVDNVIYVPTLDEMGIRGDDTRTDHLVIGEKLVYHAGYNTNLMLNVDLITNFGEDDIAEFDVEDIMQPDKFVIVTPMSEIQALDQNRGNDLYQGLFLNVNESVLNDAGIVIPDVVDTIYYTTTGITVTAFPSLHKYVGAVV